MSASGTAAVAADAAAELARRTGRDAHDVAVVLGSGWRPAADVLCGAEGSGDRDGDGDGDAGMIEFPMSDLPGFLPPTAEGHGGTVRSLEINGLRVLVLLGRTHGYEGHPVWRTVHAVRTAAAAGVRRLVLTNAAGGLADGMTVGEPVLISDHLNMTGRTPLVGADFVNLVDAYSPGLRSLMQELRPGMREAVYAMMPGPQYETPAEIGMLRTLGAGLVGMSTVYETIAARAEGVEVLGLSLVTNLAAGITGEALNHEEVLAAGAASATEVGSLLRTLTEKLGDADGRTEVSR
ncbi:purine-nucleoside phosphorylase [Corynebacterium glyciniphilum]|uniref:purine-nucleoside phosphorylase n=1 Tax=Corynebacterium glyciniphilum TaxID=1404244 RepID=UPI00264A98D7|nr:purine-nucleoside phosphorylase [Corynebacterium glyciniphilum]MDN5683294.1 purine-nucleoside phosphorylase [Corynebacterium glyciniphilum]MDN6706596.1 purine-nucleoside phosphorylase [Corynebacterium glyciniphilum]